MARVRKETKELYFSFTSYINLLDVFHLYCQVWNNRTGIICTKVLPARCLYETV